MDPLQAWMLVAFVSVMTAALLLLEVGMRRTRRVGGRRLSADVPVHRRHDR
ncbi:MAG: hypothetical protein ACJ77D_00750 [Chloroflexota bacterium]